MLSHLILDSHITNSDSICGHEPREGTRTIVYVEFCSVSLVSFGLGAVVLAVNEQWNEVTKALPKSTLLLRHKYDLPNKHVNTVCNFIKSTILISLDVSFSRMLVLNDYL